jgi:hypothetical protein
MLTDMDANELKAAISKYVAATNAVDEALSQGTDLDHKAPEGWSARMVVHHLADSETSSYSRLRSLLGTSDIKNSLAVYKAVRASSADVLNRISVSDLAKEGIHSERGKYTLEDWLRIYSKHPVDHADQIVKAFKGLA